MTGIAFAFSFGAVDQYLGSLWSSTHLGFWTADVSQMSAPWLALAFLAGLTAEHARAAAVAGTSVTFAALLGYFVMTLSPLESVGAGQIHLLDFVDSQLHVLAPALLTGPLWGWLGWRWRTARSWPSATLLAGGFCLEPLARLLTLRQFRLAAVGVVELGIGVVLLTGFALAVRRWDRPGGLPPRR